MARRNYRPLCPAYPFVFSTVSLGHAVPRTAKLLAHTAPAYKAAKDAAEAKAATAGVHELTKQLAAMSGKLGASEAKEAVAEEDKAALREGVHAQYNLRNTEAAEAAAAQTAALAAQSEASQATVAHILHEMRRFDEIDARQLRADLATALAGAAAAEAQTAAGDRRAAAARNDHRREIAGFRRDAAYAIGIVKLKVAAAETRAAAAETRAATRAGEPAAAERAAPDVADSGSAFIRAWKRVRGEKRAAPP
jgi:hypothetical protein